LNIEVPQLF